MSTEILLIDDDADEFEVFTEALYVIDKTIKCTLSKNLDDALEYLQTNVPDYIFIDFNMPKENGLDCLAELKKLRKLEKSRIILYSNYIDEEMYENAMTLGAHNCIRKPSMINVLAKKLKEIVKD